MLKPTIPPPKLKKKNGFKAKGARATEARKISLATTVGITVGLCLIITNPVLPTFMKVESVSGLTDVNLNTKSIQSFIKNNNEKCYYICTDDTCSSYNYTVCKKENTTPLKAMIGTLNDVNCT